MILFFTMCMDLAETGKSKGKSQQPVRRVLDSVSLFILAFPLI